MRGAKKEEVGDVYIEAREEQRTEMIIPLPCGICSKSMDEEEAGFCWVW